MRARSGAATPIRNSHSVGGGISGKRTTLRHTRSGGAAISTVETTSYDGAGSFGSDSTRSGARSAAIPVVSWPRNATARPSNAPGMATSAARGEGQHQAERAFRGEGEQED